MCLAPEAHSRSLFLGQRRILQRLSPRAWVGDVHRSCVISFLKKKKNTRSLNLLTPQLNCQVRQMAEQIIDQAVP